MAPSVSSVVPKRVYLAVYNWTVFIGWSLALYLALKTLKESGYGHVYKSVEKPLQLAQSAAVLEIIHILLGLVRSPITATLPQILGRLYITWGILWSFPGQTQTHILVSTLVFSWSITEIVRYSFFGMKEALGFAPSWLLWLRYSTFFLLHPIGVTSEIGLIYIALPDIKESEKYSIKMPNKWNFSFYFFYAAIFTIGIFSIGMNMDYSFLHANFIIIFTVYLIHSSFLSLYLVKSYIVSIFLQAVFLCSSTCVGKGIKLSQNQK